MFSWKLEMDNDQSNTKEPARTSIVSSPRKRKSSIGRCLKKARQNKSLRKSLSDEVREEQMLNDRERKDCERKIMTEEEKEKCKENDRERKACERKRMTVEEKENCKENDRERKACERENMSDEQRREDSNNRSSRRTTQRERLAELQKEFPPNIDEEQVKNCISDFIKATSFSSLSYVICGICAEQCREYAQMSIGDIPGRELLCHEESGFPNLSEYMIGDLLLHHKGVDESFAVNCCNSCLNTLRKGKLPATSIANNSIIIAPLYCPNLDKGCM